MRFKLSDDSVSKSGSSMRKKYIGIALPESLIKEMDKIIKEGRWDIKVVQN